MKKMLVLSLIGLVFTVCFGQETQDSIRVPWWNYPSKQSRGEKFEDVFNNYFTTKNMKRSDKTTIPDIYVVFNHWSEPKPTKRSLKDLPQHFEDYLAKCERMGIPDGEDFYQCRININAYEQFEKEFNIDLKKGLREFYHFGLAENYDPTSFVFTATVLDSALNYFDEYPYVPNYELTKYKLKIDKIFSGGDMFRNPEEITLLADFGVVHGRVYSEGNDMTYSVGDKLLIFYPVAESADYSREINHRVFSNLSARDFIPIYKIASNGELFHKRPIGDKYTFKYSLDEVQKIVQRLEELNQTKNFYDIDFK